MISCTSCLALCSPDSAIAGVCIDAALQIIGSPLFSNLHVNSSARFAVVFTLPNIELFSTELVNLTINITTRTFYRWHLVTNISEVDSFVTSLYPLKICLKEENIFIFFSANKSF